MLAQNDIHLPANVIDSLSVTLTNEQFEKAVTPVVREAVSIAQGLVANAFKNQSETVDWLILSGKTCNLQIVERELYRAFSKSDYFVWNEERVTFEPEYTKLATSAGACLAEKLRQLSFAPQQAKQLLRKGANQLYYRCQKPILFSSLLVCTRGNWQQSRSHFSCWPAIVSTSS